MQTVEEEPSVAVAEFDIVIADPLVMEDIEVSVASEGEPIARELLNEVLEAVFKRVEDKASYERKRKTWNKQRTI